MIAGESIPPRSQAGGRRGPRGVTLACGAALGIYGLQSNFALQSGPAASGRPLSLDVRWRQAHRGDVFRFILLPHFLEEKGERPMATIDDVFNLLKAVNEVTLKRMEDAILAIKTKVGA